MSDEHYSSLMRFTLKTVRPPTTVQDMVTCIWFMQLGMAVALRHPEYAQAWIAFDPADFDFDAFADAMVQAVPLEGKL